MATSPTTTGGTRAPREFMGLLRRELTETAPFDYDGEFYQVRRAYSSRTGRPRAGSRCSSGGASPTAIAVGAEQADVYMLWGEPVAQIAERIAQIRAAASQHGRAVRFSLSVRPIVAATEEAAWQRAEEIRAFTEQRVAEAGAARVQSAQLAGRADPVVRGRMFGFGTPRRSGPSGCSSRAPSATCTTSGCGTASPG